MNRIAIALAIVLAAASSASLAQMGGMKGMDMKSDAKADGKVHRAKGTVSKVDAKAGTVTINHQPVATMNWPSMSMAFKARDKAMLEKVKQGQKVEFDFVQSGKDYIVTDIK